MSIVKHFVDSSIRNLEIDEFLAKELGRAGFGGAEVTKTPLGTRIIIYAASPGMVIGRRGTNIRDLGRILEEKFKLFNPQIAVSELEVPQLNPRIMASRIAEALQRGLHHRRTGFWALNQIMKAGAMGCEITIRGKLTTQRHRYEKYRQGYIPKSGDPALKNVKTGVTHVKLKPGIIGIKVRIVSPNSAFPDRVEVKHLLEEEVQVEKEPPSISPTPREEG